MLQFRIASLLIATTTFAVFLGIVFATPALVALTLLTMVTWIAPSFWISGIVYSKGRWRAFFIGGVASGSFAQVVLMYFATTLTVEAWMGLQDWNAGNEELYSRMIGALCFLGPGVIAILGGLTSSGVCRFFQRASKPTVELPSQVGQMQVIEGRLKVVETQL